MSGAEELRLPGRLTSPAQRAMLLAAADGEDGEVSAEQPGVLEALVRRGLAVPVDSWRGRLMLGQITPQGRYYAAWLRTQSTSRVTNGLGPALVAALASVDTDDDYRVREVAQEVADRLLLRRFAAGREDRPGLFLTEEGRGQHERLRKLEADYRRRVPVARIALEAGVTERTVNRWVKAMGIPRAGRLPDAERREMARLYKGAGTVATLALQFRISTFTVRKILREQGVIVRSPGRPGHRATRSGYTVPTGV